MWGFSSQCSGCHLQSLADVLHLPPRIDDAWSDAIISGSKLKLQLGYSHDIDYEIPKEVKIECPKQNIIKLTSYNKDVLGAVAAKIRSYRKPEPFKGKGIKYENEYIHRKEGKKK